MSIIRLKDERELEQKFLEVIKILKCMRNAQKAWHNDYGTYAKQNRQQWEERADDFLSGLRIQDDYTRGSMKTIIESEKKSE